MDLKTGIFSLAVGSLLLGSAARADDTQHLASAPEVQTQTLRAGSEQGSAWNQQSAPTQQYAYNHNGSSRRSPQPQAPRNSQGRYELKRVQQFIPGHYEQAWVKQECRFIRSGDTCPAGYYEQRWVPGHYETVEQWVWVPAQRRGPGSRWG
jgi:hypothetical protein